MPNGITNDNIKVLSSSSETNEAITQLWHSNGKCPTGTIPVRRTKKEDVLRASSVKTYGKKSVSASVQPNSIDLDMINQNGHQVTCRIL